MSYSAIINELLEEAHQHDETIDPTTIGIYTLRDRLYVVLETVNCNTLTFLWSPASQQWERTEALTAYVLRNCREWVLSHDGELWHLDDDDNSRLLIETVLDGVSDVTIAKATTDILTAISPVTGSSILVNYYPPTEHRSELVIIDDGHGKLTTYEWSYSTHSWYETVPLQSQENDAHVGASDDDWDIDISDMTDAELDAPLTDDDDDDADIILTMPEGSEPTINLADILN